MKEIKLSQTGKNQGKYIALVDNEDYDRLIKFSWSVVIWRNNVYAYRAFRINGKRNQIKMHCEILGGNGIDHIDGNGLNNQKSNLRFCTHHENMMNQRPNRNTSSIFKGVCWHKQTNKWVCHIKINYKNMYLGLYKSEIEAAKAYDLKARELFGEYANLNFNQ